MGTIARINRYFCRYWLNLSKKRGVFLQERMLVSYFFKENIYPLSDSIVYFKFESGLDYFAPDYIDYIRELHFIILEWNTLLKRVDPDKNPILKATFINEIISFLRNNDIREYDNHRLTIGSAILKEWQLLDSNQTIYEILTDILEKEERDSAFLFSLKQLLKEIDISQVLTLPIIEEHEESYYYDGESNEKINATNNYTFNTFINKTIVNNIHSEENNYFYEVNNNTRCSQVNYNHFGANNNSFTNNYNKVINNSWNTVNRPFNYYSKKVFCKQSIFAGFEKVANKENTNAKDISKTVENLTPETVKKAAQKKEIRLENYIIKPDVFNKITIEIKNKKVFIGSEDKPLPLYSLYLLLTILSEKEIINKDFFPKENNTYKAQIKAIESFFNIKLGFHYITLCNSIKETNLKMIERELRIYLSKVILKKNKY